MMLCYVTIVSVYIILNMWQGLSRALLLWNYYYGTAQRQLGTCRFSPAGNQQILQESFTL